MTLATRWTDVQSCVTADNVPQCLRLSALSATGTTFAGAAWFLVWAIQLERRTRPTRREPEPRRGRT